MGSYSEMRWRKLQTLHFWRTFIIFGGFFRFFPFVLCGLWRFLGPIAHKPLRLYFIFCFRFLKLRGCGRVFSRLFDYSHDGS